MSESQFFCPRLIDYLAIVGAHPNSSKRSSLYELQNNGTNNDEYSGVSSTISSNDDNFYIQVSTTMYKSYFSLILIIQRNLFDDIQKLYDLYYTI